MIRARHWVRNWQRSYGGVAMGIAGLGLYQLYTSRVWRGFHANSSTSFRRAVRNFGFAVAVGGAYYVGMRLGFVFKPRDNPISTLWPPNAILLAILLFVPIRKWWFAGAVVLPAHLLCQLSSGIPFATSIGWYLGNVGEAMIGAACLLRFVSPQKMFKSSRGALGFLVFAVILAPLLTSFLDIAVVVFTGMADGYWALWWSRFLSNVLGELVFVPFIVAFWLNAKYWIAKFKPRHYVEVLALALCIVIATTAIFEANKYSFYSSALVYVPLSFLLWAALRFGITGLSASFATVAILSIHGTLHGNGPFAVASLRVSILSLQVLLCTVATPLIVLTSVVEERREIERQLRQLAHQLIGAQEEERQRIARELHDDIGQQLALISVGLEQLKDVDAKDLQSGVARLSEQVEEASSSARELSHGLHPAHLEYVGLESAIRRLCQDVGTKRSLSVHCVMHELPPIDRRVSLCLYRIVQEALQNVVRHSGASEVRVSARERGRHIVVRVVDNGSGFAKETVSQNGLGIIGMRERLQAVDGNIRIISQLGRGTMVEATVRSPEHVA